MGAVHPGDPRCFGNLIAVGDVNRQSARTVRPCERIENGGIGMDNGGMDVNHEGDGAGMMVEGTGPVGWMAEGWSERVAAGTPKTVGTYERGRSIGRSTEDVGWACGGRWR